MKNILSVMLPILLLLSCSAMASDKMLTYQNQDFGFAVDYPSTYRLDEIKWVKESTGVTLSTKESSITVQAMPTGTNYANVPFDEYVRIAASSEIQNFNKLASIESFVSDYMIKGYKTWWEANEHQDLDGSSINSTSIVGPIYYFAPEIKQKLSGQPVKVIMISCFSPSGEESALKMDMENVAKSFRYVASIKMFFKKGNHGKQYVIEKRKAFRIELPSNPTTGYNWYINNMNEAYFKVLSSGFVPSASNLMGAGGASYFEILPLLTGVSQISLLYYRSWEGPASAVDEYKLKILIK